MLLPQETEAQFLQKLAKGLNKVNNALEQVEESVEEFTEDPLSAASNLFQRKNKKQKGGNDAEAVEEASNSAYEESEPEPTFDESDFEEVEPQYPRPYIGPNTKYMLFDSYIHDDVVGAVHEGVFSIKRNNYFEFWTVDGTKLFNADWEYCNERGGYGAHPKFSCGVASARHRNPNSTGKRVISLLYLDGSVRELDPTWQQVTTFQDGLALVTQGSGYSKTDYFYINIRGEKQYPNLEVYGGESDAMRPLCDGLRAYKADVFKWGYIDANGNIAIEPQYAQALDFSEGYAWVEPFGGLNVDNNIVLIDTEGNVVFDTGYPYARVTPVKNGRFFISSSGSANWTMYDVSGKSYGSYSSVKPFRDGYALVCPNVSSMLNPIWVIDTEGRRVRELDGPTEGDLDETVRFSKQGIAPLEIEWGDYVLINPRGDYLLRSDYRIAGYTDCGYSLIKFDDSRGIIDLNGEVVWVFSLEVPNQPILIRDPDPDPDPDPEPEPIWPPEIVDPRQPPVGPKDVITTKYTVKVNVEPSEGGTASVSPQREFKYGETATLSASPASDEWKVASVTTNVPGLTPVVGEPFAIFTDVVITVKFIEKDDDLNPPFDGALIGTRNFQMEDMSIPVNIYAEMSTEPDIATPYGSNTYGFIVAMFNPRERIVTEEFAANIFSAPLRISGYHYNEATGERWLVADGGLVTFGNLKITPDDGFAMLWFNLIMAANGQTSPQVSPRHYRIEMLDYNEETGEFTCGRLQTHTTEYGWLDGGDERLVKKKKGFMMVSMDSGIPADFFMGAKMQKCQKRNDVDWYPPLNWYDGDQSILDGIVDTMKYAYEHYESEYDVLFR